MIEVDRLTKRYGSFVAVDDVSFHVAEGDIVGFLGVNGAGKTSTLRVLAGILRPSSGTARIKGFDLVERPSDAKRVTGFIPDRPYLYAKLTAFEFLVFVADLYLVPPRKARERIEELLSEYGLTEWRDELIESFSHGMKQRLATCGALVHDPSVLVVDEPMVGLDPHGAKFLKKQFRTYAARGMSVLLSTHSLNVAEEVADRLVIIDHGRLVTVGTLAEVRAFAGNDEEDLEGVFLKLTGASYAAQAAGR